MSGIDIEAQIGALAIQIWPIEKVIPYAANAKVHTDDQIEKLYDIIRKRGWDVPIVVDGDGVIIKGHGRREVGFRKGIEFLPVIIRNDLSDEEVRLARIEDNEIAGFGSSIDAGLMQKEIEGLIDSDTELEVDEDLFGRYYDFGDLVDEDAANDADYSHPPGDDDDLELPDTTVHLVVVQCAGPKDQEVVYNMVSEQGYKCKVQSL